MMSNSNLKSFVLIIFLVIAGACSPSRTTQPMPPTETPAPALDTPVPPTEEVLPSATLPPPATEAITPEVISTSNTWMRTYGGRGDDTVDAILLVEDGGFYLGGATNIGFETGAPGMAYLVRTDSAGEVLWEQTYADLNSILGIYPTVDGGLLLSGITSSPETGDSDIFLMQTDQDGNELWSSTFGGPLDEFGTAWPMEDGGYIVGGSVVDPNDIVVDDPGVAGYGGFSGRSNLFLTRIDAEGNELWSHTIGGERNIMASGGLLTSDGGFLLLGGVLNYPAQDDDIFLVKIDQDGEQAWSRTWEEGNLIGNRIIQVSDGNYLIAGGYTPAGDFDSAGNDFMFIKVDPNGEQIWTSIFGDDTALDWAFAVVEASDGGFVAVGDITRDMFTWDADIILVKIDENGQPVWQQIIETNTHTMLRGILEHPQGGYVIIGSTYRGSNFDILLIRTDAEGNVDR
jgi:hypothetical protein